MSLLLKGIHGNLHPAADYLQPGVDYYAMLLTNSNPNLMIAKHAFVNSDNVVCIQTFEC